MVALEALQVGRRPYRLLDAIEVPRPAVVEAQPDQAMTFQVGEDLLANRPVEDAPRVLL